MKHIILMIFLTTFLNGLYSQTTKLTINDVYNANELVFYGFDFSNFRLIEPDRLNEGASIRDINFPAWNSYVLTELPMNKMAKWFKKATIIYHPIATTIFNSKVFDSDVVVRLPYKMEDGAIQKTISKFEKPNNLQHKIGLVINVEYFQKNKHETSAYVTFFDISTGAIISSEKMINDTADGNGLTNYWGRSLLYTIKFYVDKIYSKGL